MNAEKKVVLRCVALAMALYQSVQKAGETDTRRLAARADEFFDYILKDQEV